MEGRESDEKTGRWADKHNRGEGMSTEVSVEALWRLCECVLDVQWMSTGWIRAHGFSAA